MVRKLSDTRQAAIVAVALFGLNAAICWPLFWTEYLAYLQSNEGAFMSIGKYLVEQWPHVAWFSWFNGGTPLENAYFPLVPGLVAAVAGLAHCSAAHAFHFLAALGYAVGPAFLFLFARKACGRVMPALVTALAWSLVSPAVLLPQILHEIGTPWGLRRLHTIVFYGETPHNLALSLLPLGWLLLLRYWERPGRWRFALAAIAAGAIMLSNAFGLTVVVASSGLLLVSLEGRGWKRLLSTGAVLITGYLLICRGLPLSLLRQVALSSQTLGGDYRLAASTKVLGALLLLALAGLWWAVGRGYGGLLRFAAVFTAGYGGVTVLWYWKGIGLLPSAHRYVLETEAGVALLLGMGLYPLLRRRAVKAVAVLAALLLFAMDCGFARRWIRPADITQSFACRQALWIGSHLPGQRVMVSGDAEFWFNLFADNPQLSAGHEGAANWVQRVAVYTIYSGQNAGERDGPISVLWLKAFGCGAITVPGPGSGDYLHPVRNPGKFAGLLPLVWREGDDFIYQVPLRSASLAHVIPAGAVVASRPVHGLDVEPLSRYVAALEDPALAPATLAWRNAERGKVTAKLAAGQVVSVQIGYDPGWRARVAGRDLPVRSDGLGMMVLTPDCRGECTIDLEFTGGTERRVCTVIGIATALALMLCVALPGRGPRND